LVFLLPCCSIAQHPRIGNSVIARRLGRTRLRHPPVWKHEADIQFGWLYSAVTVVKVYLKAASAIVPAELVSQAYLSRPRLSVVQGLVKFADHSRPQHRAPVRQLILEISD
jgi:hypothetical protein